MGFAESILRKLNTNATLGIDGSLMDLFNRARVYGENKNERKMRDICTISIEAFSEALIGAFSILCLLSLTLAIINDGWENGF